MARLRLLAVLIALTLMMTGCSHMSATQQRTLSGGAIGAGAGAALSAIAGGHILMGTVIGAGLGAVGGLVYDDMQKKK